MKIFRLLVVFCSFLLLNKTYAQADCILGVGLTSDSIISDVFQLNKMQHEKLVSFSAELKYRNDLLNNELQNVKSRHPQSNVKELSQLADKYKSVMDSMTQVQTMIDKRMLTLFNSKQYELYRNLCKEASRSPFIVIPTVYSDSINNENR
ncbi:hypothetical protein SAMN04488008_103386 [Maribacter orientalis]|uniref:Periplasmic chaperone for outer membrane proteins Skp n=2 Tax=Maribacter orientalis TaxID=228957 RepID=A0A1H7P8V2_9FLAO|nr:hypothetical protein SAMN04488008_103386 [Maribacter orientalis]